MGRFSFLALALLAGCASQAAAPCSVQACPVAPEYPKSFEMAAGQQLFALPQDSPVVVMMGDYGKMRVEARDCQR